MLFTSAYQYVQWRYNTATRVVASLFFCVSVTIFLAIVLYVPALAFAQVTNLSIYITVVITGVICTVYTTIGGIKAVVWTDAIQIIILLLGLVVIAIVGSIEMGGGASIWKVAGDTGRLNWNDFRLDPRDRTSFWSQVLGTAVVYIGVFISNQMAVQRYMSVPSAAKAQGSLYVALLMALPLYILIFIIGLILNSYYADCDPLVRGVIKTGDQIFPLFLIELLGDYYGIPGLIMSSIFAAALSSVSSVINALSAVVLEDFIEPALLHFKGKKLDDRKRRWIAVGIVIFFGAATIGLSFVASSFTSKIVQASNVVWGVIGGPLAGIFIMGFLMPFCNSWGAISGMFTGLIIALWISIGNIVHIGQPTTLPAGFCNNKSFPLPRVNPNITLAEPDPLTELYLISFAWYGTIGTGVCLIVGIIVSLATGGYKQEHRKSIKPGLMFSVADNCCCCCPMACIKCYRCGVEFDKTEEIQFIAKKGSSDEQSNTENGHGRNGSQRNNIGSVVDLNKKVYVNDGYTNDVDDDNETPPDYNGLPMKREQY